MPWQGIWFDPEATEGKSRSPEWFQRLVRPLAYPYPHSFIEEEGQRLRSRSDPSRIRRGDESFDVFYSFSHDGVLTQLDGQGCRILSWLFGHFALEEADGIAARFSETPVVIHEPHPVEAAALGNALTLLRFLDARPDQAVAKILLQPWTPLRMGPRVTALEYESRVLEFLQGETFYPTDVTLFDVLERHDLKAHRALGPCCETQIGFVKSILEWIDECWPQSDDEAAELTEKLRRSLADEARTLRAQGKLAKS